MTASAFYFEYDADNKVLAVRFTRVTDEVLRDFFAAAPRHIAEHDVQLGIFDMTHASPIDLTADALRQLAHSTPLIPDPMARFVVAVSDVAFGMARLFQLSAPAGRESLFVVRSLDEAYQQLKIPEGRFTRLT
jgi:hypothetical protein